MAYNEERNIGRLLDALLAQRLRNTCIREIIVVASGCTDRTADITAEKSASDNRIALITEPQRRGKASAINLFLKSAACEICVLQGADTIPGPDTIEKLTSPFSDPQLGMAGARPVPLNSRDTFPGYVAHFLWELHHEISLRRPKCGELVAFRRVFDSIPENTIVDEPRIEALVRAAGLKTVYAPEAVVFNLGPSTIGEIIMRRRSIVRGYLELSGDTPFRTSTQARGAIAAAVARRILSGKEPLLPALGAIAVEAAARLLGRLDFHLSRRPGHIWTIAPTTKSPADFMEDEEKKPKTTQSL